MTFLETVEKNKKEFMEKNKITKPYSLREEDLKKYWDSLKEEEKKEYEINDAWHPFLANYLEDKQGIDWLEDVEADYDDLLP